MRVIKNIDCGNSRNISQFEMQFAKTIKIVLLHNNGKRLVSVNEIQIFLEIIYIVNMYVRQEYEI